MSPEVINYILAISGIILSGFVKIMIGRMKEMSDKLEKLKDDHYDLKANLPVNYVGKTDFQYVLDNLFSQLTRIEDKIDNKLDKK